MARSLQVIPHSGFEALAAAFLREALARPRSPVPHPVVVPSVAFSDRLQAWIARHAGVCMGLDFITPQTLVLRVVGREDSPWTKTRLVWRVVPHAAALARRFGVVEPSPRDAFALAGVIADRLDQYGHCRPEILRAWAEGRDATGDPEEHWQRTLWEALASSLPHDPHPALELMRKAEDSAFWNGLRERLGAVTVLAAGSFDPLLAEVLGMLAETGTEVRVHALLPSLGFLADLRKRGEIPVAGDDPEGFALESGNPLLASMARQAAGVFALLGRLDENYAAWPEPVAAPPDDASLLRRIQSDIRAQRPPAPGPRADGSLRVHACFGPLREVEALKDELFRAFAEIPGLRQEDVLIAAPQTETYAPLVEAVFGDGPIHVRPMERTRTDRPAGNEAVAALLSMAAAGRYRASELLALLELPAILKRLAGDADPDAMDRTRRWVIRAGLTHGIDGLETGRWSFARDRLIAGRWFGEDRSARYPNDEYAVPVSDVLGGSDPLLASFLAWHASLGKTMLQWAHAATPEAWAERLRAASAALFDPGEDGLAELQAHFATLAEADCTMPLDAGAILDWFESATPGDRVRAPFSGSVALGRLKQLQNLPCRVLGLLGMADATFPARHANPSWDLLQRMPQPWDHNPRTDDRQLFLDAILAPTDRLIITAPVRNVRTGKREPFASPLDELLRVAEAMGAHRSDLVVEHRLQPFSEDYFIRETDFPRSFDPSATAIARALREETAPVRFFNEAAASSESRATAVDAKGLARFWGDPALAFLQAQGITLRFDEADDAEYDAAPAVLDALRLWSLKTNIAEAILRQNEDLDLIKAWCTADRGLPPKSFGTHLWKCQCTSAAKIASAFLEQFHANETVAVCLSNARVTATFARSHSGAILAWRVGKAEKAHHFLAAWIIALVTGAAGQPMETLFLDESDAASPRVLPSIPQDTASETLTELVAGYLARSERPICYAPETSEQWAKKGPEAARQIWSADDAWNHTPGEGLRQAAALAWRDADPFGREAEWEFWVKTIARPLLTWRSSK